MNPIPYLLQPPNAPVPGLGEQLATAQQGQQQLARLPAPMMAPPMAGPSLPALSAAVMPAAHPNQVLTDEAHRNYLLNSGSGVQQITHPVDANGNPTGQHISAGRKILGGLATAGDIATQIAGSVFLPAHAIAAAIPGTTFHHQMLLHQATQNLANDQAAAQQDAVTQGREAMTQDQLAQMKEREARAQGIAPVLVTPEMAQAAGIPELAGSTISQPSYQKLFTGTQTNQARQTVAAGHDATRVQTTGMNDATHVQTTGMNNETSRANNQNTNQTHQAIAHGKTAAAAPSFGTPQGGPDPMVQAIIDGRAPAPNVRTKQGMALMHAVTAADPTYDASRYNTYQAMQREMTSGSTGKNINALNTLLNHINEARQHIPANGSISLLNTLENAGGAAMGHNPTGKFDTDANGITGEFGKLVTGGVATVEEQKHLERLLNHNASTNTLSDNLDEIEQLAKGKLAGIQKQVQSAVHPGAGSNMPNSLPLGATPYSQTATGQGGHKIGSNDNGQTWFDVQTGKQVQ